jgi:protein CpxP
MKSNRIHTLTIAAIVVLAVAAAFAQGPHGFGGPEGGPDHAFGPFTDALDLTSAQQDQIKAIWDKEKVNLDPLMKQEHQNHADMRALETSGAFDEAKTRALATQHAQTTTELEVVHARIRFEMQQVLTADQKTKLASLEAKHEARMSKHGPPPEE